MWKWVRKLIIDQIEALSSYKRGDVDSLGQIMPGFISLFYSYF